MSDLSEVYSAIKRVQSSTIVELRILLQSEYSPEWTSKLIDLSSTEKTISRRLKVLIDLGLVDVSKEGKLNVYSIIHNFPVKSRAPEIMDQLKTIFKEDETLYAKAQKPIIELLNEIKTPYYTRQNVEDISSKEKVLAKIEEAIKSKNYINIMYKDGTFKVQPLKIAEFKGIWYLLSYFDDETWYKKFRIIDTIDVKILNENYLLSKKQNLDIENWHNVWHDPDVTPTRVKLWISHDIIKYFYQTNILDINSYSNRVEPKQDGVEYDVYITHIMELLPEILSWLPDVVILEQEGEIDAILKLTNRLKKMLDHQSSVLKT